MLHLLIDTSTWLDLAKRRDGQKWIVAVRLLVHWRRLELLVPPLVLDEFTRNRPRIEASMTQNVSERFRLIKQDLNTYGGEGREDAAEMLDSLAHQVPLIGAMTTRNFDDIAALLTKGRAIEATPEDHRRVVQRGLDKRAPFHRSKNSVADAVLIEAYASRTSNADLANEPHAFVTSNSEDFSAVGSDRRQPHEDLAELFAAEGSSYGLGVEGLSAVLSTHFNGAELGDYGYEDFSELLEESDFQEEPRRLDEIQAAEQEFFDRISSQRAIYHVYRNSDGPSTQEQETQLDERQARLEQLYGDAGPYSDFEWGMVNGKLSALRWVLGSEWDFLDT